MLKDFDGRRQVSEETKKQHGREWERLTGDRSPYWVIIEAYGSASEKLIDEFEDGREEVLSVLSDCFVTSWR